MSRWLVALGILSILSPAAASAVDRARSAPRARSSQVVTAPGSVPLLLTDPITGASVRIWSRTDGFTTKIAWARNDGAGWGPSHDLTFGLGVDRDPSVAITSAGAWLFWRDDRDGVFYAPLEIGSGRLQGAPSSLATTVGLPGPRPEGGSDTPVVLGSCDPTDPTCILQRQRPPSDTGQPNPTAPPVIGTDGGTDTPVTISSATSSSAGLISASEPTCERTIVSVSQGSTLLVFELDGAGRVRRQRTVAIGAGVKTEDAAAGAGTFYLQQACGN
ncbi:MAG TPA: hypothetical protein VGS03_17765 [Candidatus Polarisedimenticolia bacterium]|jgi:hypothetical protein|nr:hypothetical protein [Candidatus Polarisedimenticolia bacterium]